MWTGFVSDQFNLVIPSRNAGSAWEAVLDSLETQSCQPGLRCLVDSESTDATVALARTHGFSIEMIEPAQFNHGGTRQLMVDRYCDEGLVVFMTQDAQLVSPDALCRLLRPFDDPTVGAVYGRQLPRVGAGLIEAHARLFNYPETGHVCEFCDAERMGIKAAFMSNSFAAYRTEALAAVGGFPSGVILGEDTIVAAKMLMAGWKVAYQADAQAYHSHDYNYLQEFRRYFDIGVLHAREFWMLDAFGKPEGEGGRFVRSELAYLLNRAPWLIPSAVVRTVLKYLGYRLGRMESIFPLGLKRYLSMHKGYWK